MNKSEEFIRDCTRNCSNIEYTQDVYAPSYHPWLTPDEARKAVEIAREETYDKIWHKTEEDDYPKVFGEYSQESYPQIPCLVLMKRPCGYGVRFWNVTEECWDDEECDDYCCDKENVSEWAYLDDLTKL